MADAVSVPDTRQMIIGEQHNLSVDFANVVAPGDVCSSPSMTVVNKGTNEPISNALIGLPFVTGNTVVNFTFTSTFLRRNTFYAVTATCTVTGSTTSKIASAVLIIEIVY